ncbi:uncharacterized protein [Chelonus insularis]|uniref:uncharacterized protein n=1 Tax=Chelonus insularis TaxID=460826 RepID=UPI00158D4A2F|nr:uncharacterized protein LOC118066575 [Chelonus insularis]
MTCRPKYNWPFEDNNCYFCNSSIKPNSNSNNYNCSRSSSYNNCSTSYNFNSKSPGNSRLRNWNNSYIVVSDLHSRIAIGTMQQVVAEQCGVVEEVKEGGG